MSKKKERAVEKLDGRAAIRLERYLVPVEQWDVHRRKLPASVKKKLDGFQRDRISAGIGKHPEKGLFVLITAGQGPILVWAEWEK